MSTPERPSVDPRSYDLAEHFLSDVKGSTEDDRWNLAAAIQQVVEDWFEEHTQPHPGASE